MTERLGFLDLPFRMAGRGCVSEKRTRPGAAEDDRRSIIDVTPAPDVID